MADYEREDMPKAREESLRDRMITVEKGIAGLRDNLDDLRRKVGQLLREVGIADEPHDY